MAADDYVLGLGEMVESHGFAVQFVGPGEGEPQFGYTVGLSLRGYPEFVLFGLDLELTHGLLSDLANAVLRSGMTFATGDRIHRLLSEMPVELCRVAQPSEHLFMAVALAERRSHPAIEVEALQVLLPDALGNFLGDEIYSDPPTPLLGIRAAKVDDRQLPDSETRRSHGW